MSKSSHQPGSATARIKRAVRRGGAMPLFVLTLLTLVMLAALVVDMITLHVRRQAHVGAADAGALSGVRELPDQATAASRAEQVARLNGLGAAATVTVTFPSAQEIAVATDELVALGLARVAGLNTGRVQAYARCLTGAANTISGSAPDGLRPWGLSSAYAIAYTGQEVTLKAGSLDTTGRVSVPGNYYSVRLPDSQGGSDYLAGIEHGGLGTYAVGQWLDTEPGNKVGPTQQGVNYLLSAADHAPWNTQTPPAISVDNPRLIILPVMDWSQASSGLTRVQIVGFAAIYLIGQRSGDVSGVFLRTMPGSNLSFDPSLPAGLAGGIQVVRLVQ